MNQKLTNIPINTTVKVISVSSNSILTQRFFDLGLLPNAYITPFLIGPFNGIRAYLICNTLIAIRDLDAENIMVYSKEVL